MVPQQKADLINDRIGKHLSHFNWLLGRVVKDRISSKINRIYQLWDIADQIIAHYDGIVPCIEGCSHCCHIPVAILPEEAAAIGRRIGITPAAPALVASMDGRPFGINHPCPFLANNLCSIYEHRPLTCRMHTSVADDSIPCQFGASGCESGDVPLLNNQQPMMMAMLYIVQPPREEFLADLRDFFPKGLLT